VEILKQSIDKETFLMSKTVKSKILMRRDTSLNWERNNPILAAG